MGLFGPRKPCPHCGKKVRRPGDPASFLCPHCRKPGPWASPEQVSYWQRAEAEILTPEEEEHVDKLVVQR